MIPISISISITTSVSWRHRPVTATASHVPVVHHRRLLLLLLLLLLMLMLMLVLIEAIRRRLVDLHSLRSRNHARPQARHACSSTSTRRQGSTADLLRWKRPPEEALILALPVILLEPGDQVLERVQVLHVEEVTVRLHLDELRHNFHTLRNVCQNEVLWIVVEHGESVRDLVGIALLLGQQCLLHLFHGSAPHELVVNDDLAQSTIARRDVALDDLLKVLIVLVTDLESRADHGAGHLVALFDVNVNNVALEELPREHDIVDAAR